MMYQGFFTEHQASLLLYLLGKSTKIQKLASSVEESSGCLKTTPGPASSVFTSARLAFCPVRSPSGLGGNRLIDQKATMSQEKRAFKTHTEASM